MVLLMVLVIVALLASLTTEFAFSTLVDLRLTETFRDSTRSWYLAKGGIQAGRMILQQDQNSFDHTGELWGQGIPSYPVGENGTVSIAIEDLSAKINLNTLITAAGDPNSTAYRRVYRLFDHLGLDAPEDLTAAIIDWIDPDDEITNRLFLDEFNPNTPVPVEGAESSEYQSEEPSYPAANRSLTDLSELRMVRGFSPEVFQMVAPFLSVYGGNKLNLNTASPEVLLAWGTEMTEDDAQMIATIREDAPFEDMGDVNERLDLSIRTALGQDLAVVGGMFQITAAGQVGDGTRRVTAVVSSNGKNIYYVKVD